MTPHVSGHPALDRHYLAIGPYQVRASHDPLLKAPPGGDGSGRCDAVIVPTHDTAVRLGFAAALASRLDCCLLVMCTQGRQGPVVSAVRGPRVAATLALPHAHPLLTLPLRCEKESGAKPPKYRDLSSKRNTGLAVARMMGWRNVLLLDDDIRDLAPADVARAFSWLSRDDGWRVAGWKSTHFPDNSAVCHAGRMAGNEQGVFIGSGALAIRADGQLPLFPPVYNEDWCFLVEPLAEQRVLLAGEVRQLVYNPFDPKANRGGDEEFGDVLGEGLYHLLHAGYGTSPAQSAEYWRDVVAARRAFIRRIRDELRHRLASRRGPTPGDERMLRQALACLDSALRRHGDGMHRQLASFVKAWAEDQERWRSWFDALPSVGRMSDAVQWLGWPPEQFIELGRV